MKTLAEKIQVMQAALDGKPIEVRNTINPGNNWWLVPAQSITWNWSAGDYRVALTKPSINWDHVSSRFNYLITVSGGGSYLTEQRPSIIGNKMWDGGGTWTGAFNFSSFKPGTCDWKDSLVERPV